MRRQSFLVFVFAITANLVSAQADWPRFRGPNGDGVASGAKPPIEWDDAKNLAWTTVLPGPGSSSPIVVGDRIYVTCYSGYGLDRDEPGELGKLARNLVCIARGDGKILWNRAVPAAKGEDAFNGMITSHGYASHTPVSDGTNIYVFFGGSGVIAFDNAGQQLWQTKVGTKSKEKEKPPVAGGKPRPGGQGPPDRGGRPNRGGQGQGRGRGGRWGRGGRGGPWGGGGGGGMTWGSAASLLLVDDLVIVNASAESRSIRAYDKRSGKLAWKFESPKLKSAVASSPITVTSSEGKKSLVSASEGGLLCLDAKTGKLAWDFDAGARGSANATPVADDEFVYFFAGMRGGGMAIRHGDLPAPKPEGDTPKPATEEADAAKNHPRVAWKIQQGTGIASPSLKDGKLYFIGGRGEAMCVDAKSGELLHRARLEGRPGTIYASPMIADGRIYVVSRERGIFVYSLEKFELLSRNAFASDTSRFDGSPAAVGNQLIFRSNTKLHCVATDQ